MNHDVTSRFSGPLTYDKASELTCRARDASKGYKLENNTRVLNRGSHFSVRLHRTDIVEIDHFNRYKIRTGGWETVTTKDRINKYSPIYIKQRDYTWYVQVDGERTPFCEGMVFNREGNLIETAGDENPALKEKANEHVSNLVSDFLDYAESEFQDGIPEPGAGDCFICRAYGEPGEPGEIEHLYSHLKEKYIHGSLILYADKVIGRGAPGISIQMGNAGLALETLKSLFRNQAVRSQLVSFVLERETANA
jgi:hypothetical protein